MSREQKSNKADKKQALKTPKEKKADKQSKKEARKTSNRMSGLNKYGFFNM